MEQGSTYIPEYRAPAPPSDSKVEEIQDAFGKLRQFLKQTSAAERRAAKKNPGVLAPKPEAAHPSLRRFAQNGQWKWPRVDVADAEDTAQ